MFSHIMIGTNDLEKAKTFYDAVIGPLGVGPASGRWPSHLLHDPDRSLLGDETDQWRGRHAGQRRHDRLRLRTPAQADAWHAAGVAHGGTSCEDPPGVRDGGLGQLYLAYLRDPDGNKICALHRMGQ